MVLLLNLRKVFKIFLLTVIIVLVLFAILYPFLGRIAVITNLATGPYDFPGSVWVSKEPEITLQVSSSSSVEASDSYIVLDGDRTMVNIYIQPDREWVFIQPKGDNSENLIEGKLMRCTKEEVVFTIVEDLLFSGEYQEIILVRQK